ncbi:uncharacterized protein LOC142984317 [Anticarsia gemmatalis]|uniref:uncharacterized protein LOC142984317 n=1 Tax=Anticarsia gemmatalis TaxID=129554 RepID=UPI003F75E571
MEASNFGRITFNDFKWLNKPGKWSATADTLELTTDNKTDFWQGTWYNFFHNSGHVFGVTIKDDFSLSACIEADFTTLYDQAGLMIYLDEKHWLKAGIEFNDGQPMIGSVLTNDISDWATGVFPGNARKFYLRMTRKGDVICVKYSTDNNTWTLLRLCSLPMKETCFIGPMACTPTREGLDVKFTEISVTVPGKDILHSN